jgi:hypothetical protein
LADDLSTLGDRVAILSPLAVGVSAIVCTIIIHALALTRRQMSFAVSEELGRAGARRWVTAM